MRCARKTLMAAAVTLSSVVIMSAGVTVAYAGPAPRVSSATVCANSNQATMGSVFDAVLDTATPILPSAYRSVLPNLRAEGHRRLAAVGIATVAVSTPASVLSPNPDSGIDTTRDPVATYIVSQLMNVRNGVSSTSIRADRLTLNQAIETSYLLIYTTALVPLKIISAMIPSIMSLGPISVGTLISLPLSLGAFAFSAIFTATQRALEKSCLVRVDPSALTGAGEATPGTDTGVRVPPIIRELAAELRVSDGTCRPVSDLTVGGVIDRTVDYLRHTAPSERARDDISAQGARLRWTARHLMVPDNMIPENPDDFTAVESALSLGLGFVPYVGGAATQALIGLGHNISHGRSFSHLVPLSELSVDKTLTAARFAYALTTQVLHIGYAVTTSQLSTVFDQRSGGSPVNPFSFIPSPFPIINAPNEYGLSTYHHILRSLCLIQEKAGSST